MSTPAFFWTAFVALLLFLVPTTRKVVIELLCQFYVALVDRPFRSSPTDFLFSGQERPLPHSDSVWSRIQASTILKWHSHHAHFRHEKQIDWDQPYTPSNGDMIEAWDRIAEWDSKCLHPRKLESLRRFGDHLADRALEKSSSQPATDSNNSSDTLQRIFDQALAETESGDSDAVCRQFWQAIDRRPPPGAGALDMKWYRSRHESKAVDALDIWPTYPSTSQEEPLSSVPVWSPQPPDMLDAQDDTDELEAEARVIRRGQDVFYRYAGPILTVLLHFSLAGGFASPRITEVLKQTAYLVPTAASGRNKRHDPSTPHKRLPTIEDLRHTFHVDKPRADRTWSRLLETTQFVLDVMENADSLRPPSRNVASASPSPAASSTKDANLSRPERGGEGWQSAVRVRLLHTNVRRRVLKLVEKRRNDAPGGDESGYDVEKNGVPINQEDLLATLGAFSTAPLAMLQRIGISPTAQERKDFIALWRHVGFYMGIEPALLRRAFCDPPTADRTLWCTILHLFSKVEILDGHLGDQSETAEPRMHGPTIPVLIACADRPPFHTPLSAHVAISRRLLGKSLADSLSLPASSAKREVLTDIAFLGMRVPVLFGALYPRSAWERRRLELARPLLRRLIVFSFGNKRTKFEMPAHSGSKAASEARDGERVNVETQSNEHEEVPEDKEHNLYLARQWRWLMREMIAVLVVIAATLVGILATAYVYFR